MKFFTMAMIVLLTSGFCSNYVQAATYGIDLNVGKKIGFIRGSNYLGVTNNASSSVKVDIQLWYLENYKAEQSRHQEIAKGKHVRIAIPKDHDVRRITITYPNGSTRSRNFAVAKNGYEYRGNTVKGTKQYQHSKNRVETNGRMVITDDKVTVSTHSKHTVDF